MFNKSNQKSETSQNTTEINLISKGKKQAQIEPMFPRTCQIAVLHVNAWHTNECRKVTVVVPEGNKVE